MFKNMHVAIAMIVAPILAILAWFAVDYFVTERPHAAKTGDAYTLMARSNCRYDSGQCDLVNSDIKITVRPASRQDRVMTLTLTSSHELQSATLGIVDSGIPSKPGTMTMVDDGGTSWRVDLLRPAAADSTLRVAVITAGVTLYAEVPVVFLDPAT